MTWTYVLTPPAQRDLRGLDDTTQSRVIQALRRYAETGYGDVVKLKGLQDEWRLRVGDYRARFRRDGENRVIVVLRILNRREAY